MRAWTYVRRRTCRRLLLVVGIALLAVLLRTRLATIRQSGAPTFSSRDLIIYWSGARLVREGGNPYDSAALVAVERGAGLLDPDPHREGIEVASDVPGWEPIYEDGQAVILERTEGPRCVAHCE